MIKLFLFLALAGTILGESYSMKSSLFHNALIDLKDAFVPVIHKQIEHLKFPNISKGVIDVYGIELKTLPIVCDQIRIQFINSSSLKVCGYSFAMNGTAKATIDLGIAKKIVDIEISVDDFLFELSIILKSVNDKPNILATSMDLELTSDDVSVSVSGEIADNIIQVIKKLMKQHIYEEVSKTLKGMIPNLINEKVNGILNTISTDIPITDNFNIRYQYPTPSSIKDKYTFTGLVAYPYYAKNSTLPPYNPLYIPEFDSKVNSGFQFFISKYIIDSALDLAEKLDLLYMKMEGEFCDSRVKIICKTTRAPTFEFLPFQTEGHAICNVTLDNSNEADYKMDISLIIYFNLLTKNAAVIFNPHSIGRSIIYVYFKPVDKEWFKCASDKIRDYIEKTFVEEIMQKRIPLPIADHLEYIDLAGHLETGYVMISGTPILNFTTIAKD